MEEWVLPMHWAETKAGMPEALLTREWLVPNGLGGYASGTVAGILTRRYHGLLIAALPAPLGRRVMLNQLSELLRLPDQSNVFLGGGAETAYLTEFWLDMGLPVWRCQVHGFAVEKRVLMPHCQNTVQITYRLAAGQGQLRLQLRPAFHFRAHDGHVDEPDPKPYTVTALDNRCEVTASSQEPSLRMFLHGAGPVFTLDGTRHTDILYREEERRGYDCRGSLWSPGYFQAELTPEQSVTLVASTEPWETIRAHRPEDVSEAERERRMRILAGARPEVQQGPAQQLVLAADHFLITPAGRVDGAAGAEVRTVIAGYPWFTDWGRDTMISLEGLTLVTGRLAEARSILRTFANFLRDGLLPNLFPEGNDQGVYHTADATLWYFHALHRYLIATGDRDTLQFLLPKLRDIIDHHLRGTRFGIGVDPADGLLRQGEQGYQLTWMDTKVGDWVVTPRRGKAVEINALWYNALRLLEGWVRQELGEQAARPLADHADRARLSFNKRFWYADGGYLYDVVDGEQGPDSACRPNQLLAISLDHAILDRSRWQSVVETARRRLLTPVGLRSLTPVHPAYQAQCVGDLRARDAAYHQGTVWAWLIGPFIDAWIKLHPEDRTGARRFLEGFVPHLAEAGLGSISEIFDAEPPFTARGCIAQAWSVAEVLRCWVKTAV